MADDPRALVAERLARTYTAQMAALRDATERGVAAAWDTLGSYNRADIDPFLSRSLPVVEAAQTQAAALTDAYMAQSVQVLSGEAVVPAGIAPGDVVGAAVRNGTAPETVYERSFIQVWSDLSDGVQWVDAVAGGGRRARQAARTDVSLSARKAAQAAMRDKPHVVGYRRVLDGHSCRFCAVASTQRYHKADLMPLHPGCGCSVALIVGTHDPGRVINYQLLDELKNQSPDEFLKLVNGPKNERGDWDRFGFVDRDGAPVPAKGKAAKHVSEKAIRDANRDVKVVEHGELGPTLVSDRHHLDRPGTAKGTGGADDRIERLNSRGGSGGGEPPSTGGSVLADGGDEERRKQARSLLDHVREVEPPITGGVQAAADAAGGQLRGLEGRFKTEASLADKFARMAERLPQFRNLKRAAKNVEDALRYTIVFDPSDYASGVRRLIHDLEGRGYQLKRLSNTWAPGSSYRGINMTFKAPDGTLFEIQAHTPESARMRESTHSLYEEARLAPDGSARQRELMDEMASMADTLDVPPGAEAITRDEFQ